VALADHRRDLAPGAVVTEIARRSLVFTWRRRARLATAASAGPRKILDAAKEKPPEGGVPKYG